MPGQIDLFDTSEKYATPAYLPDPREAAAAFLRDLLVWLRTGEIHRRALEAQRALSIAQAAGS